MTHKRTRRNFLKSAAVASITIPTISATTSAASADFVWPVSGQITSDYGWRTINGESDFHDGLDIGGSLETPIYAARSGTAYIADYPGSYGTLVYIEHGDGYRTEYGHVNSYDVYDGEYVSRGEQIAGMGAEGNSTGVHLHFQVERNDSALSLPGNVGDYITHGTGIPKDFPGIGGDSGGSYSWPALVRGDNEEAVYSIQYLLEAHGYDLSHDGSFGPETESTVKSFQSANGLTVDGYVGPNTWSELIIYVTGTETPHWPTYAAQHHLRDGEGYSLDVDGDYGPETESVIRDFQSDAGITVDGMVGPNTWQALIDIGN
ncbi:peptidoglycan-binding protein [Haladaptatus sp. DYF46]|uniref:peptidoglycan hydrolase n=1 Tax=Haladaptatus sp. DYF46 TaxID=2886041 RepID=UPI001E29D800|nr:peptidoglycan-binding protein [Haladaptatus sp. DYF46]